MDFEIIWTEGAVGQLETILARIAEDRPGAARRVGDAIVAQVERLRALPTLGSAYPPGSRGDRRETAYRSYRIFYRVRESAQSIEVLAIWHGARREPDLRD